MTYQEIIASQSFTELETKILNTCHLELKNFYGEYFSDITVLDLAKKANLEVSTVKGVVGSLVKKKVLETESIECGDGKTREFIYFADQEDM